MATTYVTYELIEETESITLCFSCAVKKTIQKDDANIILQTTAYEFNICEICGKYLQDKIDI